MNNIKPNHELQEGAPPLVWHLSNMVGEDRSSIECIKEYIDDG